MRARAGWLQLSQLRLAAVARPPRVGVNLGALLHVANPGKAVQRIANPARETGRQCAAASADAVGGRRVAD